MIDSSKFRFIKPGEIRVRFAPSPTGFLHIGNARTCLFNYLFARKYEGIFILRIDDTDAERSRNEFLEDIIESLKWLGLDWDEGPDVGGSYGPYLQSQRKSIYEKYLKDLVEKNKAYLCFCSKEDLEKEREYFFSIGKIPTYSGRCSTLSLTEVERLRREKRQFVIRLRVPEKKIVFEDLVRGKIEFDTSTIGDFVIAKDFQHPLFNFACAIDDFEMKISHVIRAEDHLSNTPKQILIQEALELSRPKYLHLPLILAPDRSKLSKRHGAVAIREYREMGYLPEALINFLAFLGWNPGTNREIYSLPSLIKDFSVERIQKSGAIFNIKKLDFLNSFYIRQKPIDKLTEMALPYLINASLIRPIFKEIKYPPAYGGLEIAPSYEAIDSKEEISIEKIQKIISLYQERIKRLSEISELVDFFFKKDIPLEKEMLRWKDETDEEVEKALSLLENILSKIKDWEKNEIENVLMVEAVNFAKKIKREEGDRGYLFWPLRVCLTGKMASAPPVEIAEILGQKETIRRIKMAQQLYET